MSNFGELEDPEPKNIYRYYDPKHFSNEKNPGWLGYKGDYTTQLYRDYNKPL